MFLSIAICILLARPGIRQRALGRSGQTVLKYHDQSIQLEQSNALRRTVLLVQPRFTSNPRG